MKRERKKGRMKYEAGGMKERKETEEGRTEE